MAHRVTARKIYNPPLHVRGRQTLSAARACLNISDVQNDHVAWRECGINEDTGKSNGSNGLNKVMTRDAR